MSLAVCAEKLAFTDHDGSIQDPFVVTLDDAENQRW
jgi:hypothetical protein